MRCSIIAEHQNFYDLPVLCFPIYFLLLLKLAVCLEASTPSQVRTIRQCRLPCYLLSTLHTAQRMFTSSSLQGYRLHQTAPEKWFKILAVLKKCGNNRNALWRYGWFTVTWRYSLPVLLYFGSFSVSLQNFSSQLSFPVILAHICSL